MILRLSLDLPEDSAYLHMTRATARAVLQSLRVQTGIIGDVETVLTELYTNVLRHARSAEGRFSITLNLYAERLMVAVEDKGQGFSFKNVPPVGSVRPGLDGDPRIGGFGLELVALLADKMEFHRHDAAGMQIRAEKRLAYQSEGAARDAERMEGKNADLTLEFGALEAPGEGERRQQDWFLEDLAERARRMTDPEEVIADAVRSVGQFLGLSRCVFADIDLLADTCTIPPEYCADDSVASIAGVFPISAFGAYIMAEYQAGRAVVVDDVRADPVQVPEGSLAAYEAFGVRAHVSIPVVHSDRLVSVIGAHSATPRHWKPDEIALLREVVERTWLIVEVTRQNRALAREAEERHKANERTARILDSVTDGFHAVDRDWRFTYLNPQAERLISRSREEMLGKNLWDEFPEAIDSTFGRQYRRAMSEGVAVSFVEFYPPLDAWLDVRVYPSEDGLSVFFQNVTDRKKEEDALRQSEERYRLLVEGAEMGTWRMDVRTGETTFSRRMAEMHLFPQAVDGPEVTSPYDTIMAMVHPEDFARVDAAIKRAIAETTVFEIEHRVVGRGGQMRWIEGHGRAYADEDGRPSRIEGVALDITERKRAEEALRQSEERYRAVVEALTEGITVQDATGLWQEANTSAERILGLSRDQMAGRTSADPRWRTVREDGSPLPGDQHPPIVALRTGQAVRDMVMGIHRPDGTFAWLSANAELMTDPATGEPTGVVTSFFDITAQRLAQREVQARAEREALVSRIGQALLATTDPAAIQERAVALLGEALGADRCYLSSWDPAGDRILVLKDYHRADLPGVAGRVQRLGVRGRDGRALRGRHRRRP